MGRLASLALLCWSLRAARILNRKPHAAPLEVEVAPVEQKDVPVYGEWIATLDGMVNAEIKAQVTGYLLRQDYTEGSFVRKGQPLFEIDPRPFQRQLPGQKGSLHKQKVSCLKPTPGWRAPRRIRARPRST